MFFEWVFVSNRFEDGKIVEFRKVYNVVLMVFDLFYLFLYGLW